MKTTLLAVAVVAAATAATAATAIAAPSPDPVALKATITALVGFGTRHTLSSPTDPVRGIGAARAWARGRLNAIGGDCGGCLAIETIGDRFTGPRAPDGVRVEDVVALQRGTTDPTRVVIVQGHIDSRISDSADATHDAPGANDDASGVAVVLEAARLLSREKFPATIVYAVLSGEEQGLWGGQLLARTAKERGWRVAAVLNNDIVGNTHGIGGEHIDDSVRVFSEGIRAAASLDDVHAARGIGAEDDGPSRALAKVVARVAGASHGLKVFAVRRPDRFQRGGDHLPFLDAGFPAVRITEATENYDRQHQDVRVDGARHYGDVIAGVDFPYLARVAALNVATLRELATAPAAPGGATIAGAVSDDTTVAWVQVPGATGYRIRWRRADTTAWTEAKDVPANAATLVLPHVNIDDHFFAVAALNGAAESIATFAGVVPRPPPGATR